MKRTVASRAIGRGLARVEPTSPNTLVAFAAKAGSIASDGDSRNSPFTAALLKYLPRPGLDVRKALGFARDDVLKATNSRQEPFIYGSLGGEDIALVPVVAVAPPPAPIADPNSAIRRDYELAEHIGTLPVWDSFIRSYPSGFYTDLARAQRDKLGAEAARIAATEKANAAADEQRRPAIDGAKIAVQAKTAAQANAAEEARIAAEEKKALEEAKAAEVERSKAAAQAIAAEKTNSADQQGPDDKPIGQLAALSPPDHVDEATVKSDKPIVDELPRLLLTELRRVGCNTGAIDGNWNAAAQKSLSLFNKNAQTKFDFKVASLGALDAVRSRLGRVCPLICDRGYKADGGSCTKITCKTGYEPGDDNTCEPIRARQPKKPVASIERQAPESDLAKPTKPDSRSLQPSSLPAGTLSGEPPAGTIRYGVRVLVQSGSCHKGQVLELIGGDNTRNIPRQRRCISAN